jgi:hypothetical protein
MLPSGDTTSKARCGKFCYFWFCQEMVMPTKIGAGDEFWSAWVCSGVTSIGETVQVFGASALWGVSKQSVWGSIRKSDSEWVAFGYWDAEDVGLDPFGWNVISDS